LRYPPGLVLVFFPLIFHESDSCFVIFLTSFPVPTYVTSLRPRSAYIIPAVQLQPVGGLVIFSHARVCNRKGSDTSPFFINSPVFSHAFDFHGTPPPGAYAVSLFFCPIQIQSTRGQGPSQSAVFPLVIWTGRFLPPFTSHGPLVRSVSEMTAWLFPTRATPPLFWVLEPRPSPLSLAS